MYISSVKVTLHFLPHIALTLNTQQHTLKLGNSRWMYIMHIKIYISLWMETHIYIYISTKFSFFPFVEYTTEDERTGRTKGWWSEAENFSGRKGILFSPTCRIE